MELVNEILISNPIICAIKNDKDLIEVLENDIKIVFVLFGNLTSIVDISKKLHEKDKIFFVHLDMIEGLKADEQGISYLKEKANPFGIITTKPNTLKIAKKYDLNTILRLFIIDSMSLVSGIKVTKQNLPDAIEVMPGTSSNAIKKICANVDVPIIGGGLIEDKKDVLNALGSGAIAISTTCKKVWKM